MATALSHNIGQKLLKALGVNCSEVRRAVIEIPEDGAVMIHYEKYATTSELDAVFDVLKANADDPAIKVGQVDRCEVQVQEPWVNVDLQAHTTPIPSFGLQLGIFRDVKPDAIVDSNTSSSSE